MEPSAFTEETPVVRNARRILFIILGAAILVPLGSCMVWRAQNASALRALQQRARDRGEPVTLAELNASYPEIPDKENIYAALEDLWASEEPEFWQAFRAGKVPLPDRKEKTHPPEVAVLGRNWQWNRTESLSEEQLSATLAFIALRSNHMAAVRTALARPKYRARYDFEQGFDMLMPHLSDMRREARLFQAEAVAAIAQNNKQQAIQSITDIARVGHCLDKDPTLIEQLVRLAIFNIGISTVEQLVSQRELTAPELEQLETIVKTLETGGGFKLALIGERAFSTSVYDNSVAPAASLTMNPGQSGRIGMGMRLARMSGYMNADLRLMHETYAALIQCAEGPEYCATTEIEEIQDAALAKASGFPPMVMTRLMMPALGRAAEKFGRIEALRRCALAGLSVERYCLAQPSALNHEWKSALAGLPRPIGNDPFTNQPLNFKATATGYCIYSVGPDRTDDGGYVENAASGTTRGATDVGFTVDRAPQK